LEVKGRVDSVTVGIVGSVADRCCNLQEQSDQIAYLHRRLNAAVEENTVLRDTLDAVDGSVVVYDPNQRFLFANQSYRAKFPHLPPDDVLRRLRYADVLALSIAAGAIADPAARLDPASFIGRRVAEMDDRRTTVRETHHPGTDRWSQLRVRWTPGGNRVALRIDITELKRLQQHVLRAQRIESISRISGGVAHDFNNLLTVITSNLEMIGLRPQDPSRIRDWAGRALAAAEIGAQLIRQLLTFAHRDVIHPQLLEPNALLVDMHERLARAIGAPFGLQFVPGCDCGHVWIDSLQFEAAMINLVRNSAEALKGMEAPAPIMIRTSNADGLVRIAVSDAGRGMEADIAAQAIEPFFTTKPVGAGSGLGLSQVYGFATAAGGQARIATEPGRGTTVTIELPAVAGP
jgi:signal transduction histidine kinase